MKSGMKFTICRQAARRTCRFKHEHALATTRQVSCANQSIMASANND
jgi:hypothetical protein